MSGGIEVEHRALEHVRAGVDEVRVDLVAGRLLEELRDARVAVEAHEAVGRRVLDRRSARACPRARRARAGRSGRVRSMSVSTSPLSMRKRSSSSVLGELQRAAGAQRARAPRRSAARIPNARAVAEHVAHAVGEEAAGHDDVVDAVAAQPLEHVGDERPVDQRDDGLGDRRGQRPQPRALAADEDRAPACAAERRRTGRPTPS